MSDPRRPEARAGELRASILLTAAVGALLAWVAFDNGAYASLTWGAAAVAVWWAVALAAAGVLPVVRPAAPARMIAAALAALALLSLVSTTWAADAQRAYAEAARIALYLGVFVLVALLARRDTLAAWLDGLTLGLIAIALLALASRLDPSLGLGQGGQSILPEVVTRLSYPLGYWNGLAIFVALAVPLLLRRAISTGPSAIRLVAVAAIPVLAADVYLASSRGGAIVAAAGMVAFVVACGRPWAAAGASLAGCVGSAVAVLALHSRHALVDGPVTSSAARAEGRSAALLVVLAALIAALAWFGLDRAGRKARPSRRTGLIVIAVGLVAAIAAIVAAHPVARFDAFKQPPLSPNATGFTAAHLLSGSGSGRWQFWSAAVDEWRTAKLAGKGAGSFDAWWAQHGTIALTTQDAHSVFFQTLGELGLVGFVLVIAVLILGPALGFARLRGLAGQDRLAGAAAAADGRGIRGRRRDRLDVAAARGGSGGDDRPRARNRTGPRPPASPPRPCARGGRRPPRRDRLRARAAHRRARTRPEHERCTSQRRAGGGHCRAARPLPRAVGTRPGRAARSARGGTGPARGGANLDRPRP